MNNLNDSKILANALIGVEFEFYSNLSIDETAKEIGNLLNKKIQVEDKAHSEFEPTADHFKLEPDMSKGTKLMRLITGPMDYYSGRLIIIKTNQWIDDNGSTNEHTSINLKLSFNRNKIDNKNRISKMNSLKFILDFDEAQVFKFFPQRENSAYAKSIKFIVPKDDFSIFDGKYINQQNFIYPNSKYYGVNFEKRHENYLEFRYIGGKDWQKKTSIILHLIDRFLIQVWNSTETTQFSQLNAIELKRIISKNQNIIDARRDWTTISKNFKDSSFTVDLSEDPKIVSLYWSNIKERVVKLFTHGNFSKGHINYDTDTGKVQVQNGRLEYCVDLEGYEFVNCFLRGEFSYCDMFSCQIEGSDVNLCNFYSGSQITSSKLKSCYIHHSVVADDCYIWGAGAFKGTMNGGIFREGGYSKKTSVFNQTEIILSTPI